MLWQDVAILSVSALTEQLRHKIEQSFPFVWVRGEIADYKITSSGHIYFSLKDRDSQLQCVWFKGRQSALRGGAPFDPLTGEVHECPAPALELSEGLEVLCAGQISVYAVRGQYQMIVELVQASGEGAQAQAFEKLRQRLESAGYFALGRKRQLPANPGRIALLTSPTGAAIHDFLKLAAPRGYGSQIRLYPVMVQGNDASRTIVSALALANAQSWAEVIVLIRGGGAAEDLRVFNEESVATAIFNSAIPVLAGIGHEIDTSLADMTADVRAATPSHAAEILWQPKKVLSQKIDELELSLQQMIEKNLHFVEQAVERNAQALHWHSPLQRLQRGEEQCEALEQRLSELLKGLIADRTYRLQLADQKLPCVVTAHVERYFNILEKCESALRAYDPCALLQRGYAFVQTKQGATVRSIRQTQVGQDLQIVLHDGSLHVLVEKVLPQKG